MSFIKCKIFEKGMKGHDQLRKTENKFMEFEFINMIKKFW